MGRLNCLHCPSLSLFIDLIIFSVLMKTDIWSCVFHIFYSQNLLAESNLISSLQFHCQQPFMDLLSGSMSNLVALWHPLLIAMHHPCSLQAIIPLRVVKRESVTIPLKRLYCQQHLTSHQHTGNKYENNILSFSVLLPSPFVKILSLMLSASPPSKFGTT